MKTLFLKIFTYQVGISIIWFILYFGLFSSIIHNASDSGCVHLIKVIFGCSSFLVYSVYKKSLNVNRFFLSVFLFPLLISSGVTFCLLEQIINTCGYYDIFKDSTLKRFFLWFDSLGKHYNPFIISVRDPDPNFPTTFGGVGVKLYEGEVNIYNNLQEGTPMHRIAKETIEVPKEIKDKIPSISNYDYEYAKNTTINKDLYLQSYTINKAMSGMEKNPLMELIVLNDIHTRCINEAFGPANKCSIAEISVLKRANIGSFTRAPLYENDEVVDLKITNIGKMMVTSEEYKAVGNVTADKILYTVHKNPNILDNLSTRATSISSILNHDVAESSSSTEVSRKRPISPDRANADDTTNLNRNHPNDYNISAFKRNRRN